MAHIPSIQRLFVSLAVGAVLLAALLYHQSAVGAARLDAEAARDSAEVALETVTIEAVSHRLSADSLAVALHQAKADGCALTYCGDFYADDPTCGGAYLFEPDR